MDQCVFLYVGKGEGWTRFKTGVSKIGLHRYPLNGKYYHPWQKLPAPWPSCPPQAGSGSSPVLPFPCTFAAHPAVPSWGLFPAVLSSACFLPWHLPPLCLCLLLHCRQTPALGSSPAPVPPAAALAPWTGTFLHSSQGLHWVWGLRLCVQTEVLHTHCAIAKCLISFSQTAY